LARRSSGDGEPAAGRRPGRAGRCRRIRAAAERGFNQASLLARRVGVAGVLVRADVLILAVATPSQTELDAPARRATVRGAFRLRRPELMRAATCCWWTTF
jgi:predicted amidophosphoribosyltransferase